MLWRKKKLLALMNHISKKLGSPNAMVLDACFGLGVNAKECFMDLRHCEFTGSDGDVACVQKMVSSLLGIVTSQIRKKECYIIENAKVDIVEGRFFQTSTCSRSDLTRFSWTRPLSSPTEQSFPLDIMQFLTKYFCVMNLFARARTIRPYDCRKSGLQR